MIRNGDYFIYLDDQGKKAAELIEKLGFSIKQFGINDIGDVLETLKAKARVAEK